MLQFFLIYINSVFLLIWADIHLLLAAILRPSLEVTATIGNWLDTFSNHSLHHDIAIYALQKIQMVNIYFLCQAGRGQAKIKTYKPADIGTLRLVRWSGLVVSSVNIYPNQTTTIRQSEKHFFVYLNLNLPNSDFCKIY